MKKLAIMKGVRFGMNDRGHIGLSFGAYIAEGVGAPQFLDLANTASVIEAYQVGDVSRLEGKPCWVNIELGIVATDPATSAERRLRLYAARCEFIGPCVM